MSAGDVLFIAVVMFGLAVGMFIISATSNTMLTAIADTPAINNTAVARAALDDTNSAVLPKIDYLVMAVFLALVLGLIITSWFIGGNPLFIFIYFIVITITVVLGAILSNIWERITTTGIYASYLTNFPITNHLFTYFPMYIGIVGVIGVIVMYAKPYFTGEAQGNL